LENNDKIILAAYENQNLGRLSDTTMYLQLLHRNILHLIEHNLAQTKR